MVVVGTEAEDGVCGGKDGRRNLRGGGGEDWRGRENTELKSKGETEEAKRVTGKKRKAEEKRLREPKRCSEEKERLKRKGAFEEARGLKRGDPGTERLFKNHYSE